MKFLIKSILIVVVFISSLIYFFPKENLYNLLEQELTQKNIVISNEIKKEHFFGLEIKGADIYFDGINIAFVKDIDFNTFVLFTNINLDTIKIPSEFKNKILSNIEQIKVQHSVFQFSKASVLAIGEFGEFKGEILFFDRKIVGELFPSEVAKLKYRKLLRKFQVIEGKYKYEYKF